MTSITVELFYMRLLLTQKRGPKSFLDLRTVGGCEYSTYREAVKAMGLQNDQDTWKQTILEIINHINDRKQLRATYARMLVFSDLEHQSNIWEETKHLLASDFLHSRGITAYNDEIYLDALDDIHEGRTAHNMFKIPLMEYNKIRSCNIKRNSEMAGLLQMTSVIVWDEVVMANKNTLTALDITLRDILGVKILMGGIVFVCAGGRNSFRVRWRL